jgi:Zn/Cd-binding protein ZinT
MRTPQICKYCAHKINPQKCPHFERFNGKLSDNGYCKKFKKWKENNAS